MQKLVDQLKCWTEKVKLGRCTLKLNSSLWFPISSVCVQSTHDLDLYTAFFVQVILKVSWGLFIVLPYCLLTYCFFLLLQVGEKKPEVFILLVGNSYLESV